MRRVDHRWMAEALRQARRGYYSTPPNPRVGCVIVGDDGLLGAGWHEYTGGPHAEVIALAAAKPPPGADFYVTLEPCSHHGRTPPCVDAVIAARPARVVVAMQDPNPKIGGRGLEKLRAAEIDVVCGPMEAQARELNRGFVKRMEQGMPFVAIKMACSLDGRSALANGTSKWISGEAARRDVQYLRAGASAILSSAQTVLDDDPRLDLRLDSGDLGQSMPPRLPARALVDSKLRLTGAEKIFGTGGDIWIYTRRGHGERRKPLVDAGAEVIEIDAGDDGRISLPAMLRDLASRQVNEVHTECGRRLAGALIDQRLVDQAVIYMAPQLLGDSARGIFDIGELKTMEQRKTCKISDIRQVGDDLRLTVTFNRD